MTPRALLLVCVALATAAPGHAQLFAPGTFSKAHAGLQGITTCTKCHEEGNKHSNARCLDCHKEIGSRQARGEGYHARVTEQQCASCHREHRGSGASLIEWTPSKRAFGHAQTGWPLQGAHRSIECGKCHEARRVVDADVAALVKKRGRDTFLGLSKACKSCHFDEHRGQVGERCERCHIPEKFQSAPLFSHNKDARFALTGRHKKLACNKCHNELTDDDSRAGAFPAPKSASYAQLKDLPHGSCLSCHEDPHRGQFGKGCARCHATTGWGNIKESSTDFGFHDKTKFPLRGEHGSVACKSCHGPSPGRRAVFKGLKHEACADCHFDAHSGQLDDSKQGKACDRCHQVTGFLPVLFDLAMHKETRWPLEGAHSAVACDRCHTNDAKLARKLPSSFRKDLAKRGRRALLSEARLDLPEAGERCENCHQDPHGEQFQAKTRNAQSPPIAGKIAEAGCRTCHQTTSFTDLLFSHDDSSFPLVGKHQQTSCARCHSADANAPGQKRPVVVYRPLATDCAACHADEHLGQLAKAGVTDCARCHQPSGFRPARFDHDDPGQARFALTGKHAQASCASCHAEVELGGGERAARYRQLPTACAGCHEDQHQGSFDQFTLAAAAGAIGEATAPGSPTPAPGRCQECHTPAGFLPAQFDHTRTGFALRGRHQGLACGSCHGGDYQRPVPQGCAGCHQDPHAQQFGLMCASCHSEEGFDAPRFSVDAHRRTGFPLSGRHGGLPCQECHVEKRDRGFARTATDCVTCHAADALRASAVSINHQRAPLTASCRRCHEPVAFAPARLPEHDACFPLRRGAHRGVSCTECHLSLRGTTFTGSCAPIGVRCTDCHVHSAEREARNHTDVLGYAYLSARCASCHRAE